MEFYERLVLAIERAKENNYIDNLADLSRRVNAPAPSSIDSIIKEKRKSSKYSSALARELKVRLEWLADGIEPMEKIHQGSMLFYENLDELPKIDDMITVDFPSDFGMAAGNGVNNSEFQNIRSMPFYLGTLKKGEVRDPSKVIVGRIKGPSNEMLIPNGAAVGIDLGYTDVVNEELYLITIDGEERLKQVITKDDGIILRSLNINKTEFPDENLDSKEILSRGLVIRGRLWWVSWVNPIGHIKKLLTK